MKKQNLTDLIIYLKRTIDGKFAFTLSILYILLATYLLMTDTLKLSSSKLDVVFAFYLTPILFIVVLVRHRIGTNYRDKTPVIPCILSNLAVTVMTLYYLWSQLK